MTAAATIQMLMTKRNSSKIKSGPANGDKFAADTAADVSELIVIMHLITYML